MILHDRDGKATSKQEIAYQFIKSAIIDNEFEPNSMLVEAQLCERLGFSKTPIREALRRLTAEGFVESIPEKGCFVSLVSLKDFIDIFDAREMLEGMAARLCAQWSNLTARKLQEQMEKVEASFAAKDVEQYIKDDRQFHVLLVELSGNTKIGGFLETIHDQIDRVRKLSLEDFERITLSNGEHRDTVAAIVAGDRMEAERTARQHVRSVKSYLIKRHYLIGDNYLIDEKY